MNNKPIVSIIINNYNYGCFLREAIDSALAQTYPHIETIVVDDGSTDNSQEIIAIYNEQIIPVLKKNGGQASAFKAGFAVSKGEIICFLDSDDVFLPDKAAKVVSVFESCQDIGWCFHRLMRLDTNTGALLGLIPDESSSRECDFTADIKRGKLSFGLSPTSGLCFTRSLLEQILPLPEAIAPVGGDQQLRLAALALSKGFFLNEHLAFLRIHDDNAFSFRANKHQLRARLHTLTAHWLGVNFPELARFNHKLLAKGIGFYWQSGGIEKEYREVVQDYLSAVSSLERFKIRLRAVYYWLKGKPRLKGYRDHDKKELTNGGKHEKT